MQEIHEMEFDESIEDAVLPAKVDDRAVPIPLDTLKPWHQPRKQFIRERQWRNCARFLIDELRRKNAPSIRPGKINYLTLPGVDYFDVEILGGLAKNLELGLDVTGFLAEAEQNNVKARLQFREDTLVKRGLIEDTSVTFPYRLQDMSNKRSQAYRETKARAPFHIINIDACGSIAAPADNHSTRIIDALHKLVELQLDTMRDPWLLYLTTDVRANTLSEEVNTALDNAIRHNAGLSDVFRREAISCFGLDGDDLDAALVRASNDPKGFVFKFSLGFAKWLLHSANGENWDLKCLPFFCYSTTPQDDNRVSMPCLAFEFRPRTVVLRDQFDAVRYQNPYLQEPIDYSIEALNKARDMQNVDTLLQNDDNLRIQYAQSQRDLLQNAGYQATALADFDAQHLA